MAKIIALANQKGGVAKTTASLTIAVGLARRGYRVLAVDIDPQANLTSVLLGNEAALGPRGGDFPMIAELLLEQAVSATDVIYEIGLEGSAKATYQKEAAETLHVLPAHLELAPAEEQLMFAMERERVFAKKIAPVKDNYDFIVVDCPPSLGILTINALCAADGVWIPVSPGVFPMIGLNLLQGTIERLRAINPSLSIDGVIPVMTENSVISRDTTRDLKEWFGELVTNSIPKRVSIQESVAAGMDIFAYDPKGDAAKKSWELVINVERAYRG